MSGILGAFHFDRTARIDPVALKRWHETLRPWGPDGGATVSVAGCGLGQTRRSSDEPAGDGSPWWDSERRLVAVFDGQLRRANDLRSELEQHGHRFRGATQAELALAAYRQWGTACVDHLEGAFAVAVYDRRAHTLFLARDRLGIRPLFAYRDPLKLCFASNTQGILTQPGIPRVLDPQAVEDFLSYGFVPGSRSLLRNVRPLGPAHAMLADRHGVREWSYWQPNFQPDRSRNLEQQAQALVGEVESAVGEHQPSAVVALSGQLGSAVVAAAAKRQWHTSVHTVTVRQLTDDGGVSAEQAARSLAANHTTEGGLAVSPDLWRALSSDGEPPVDAHVMAWLMLAKGLARHGAVALTGVGAGLVFGSGPRYRAAVRIDQLRRRVFGQSGAERFGRTWAGRRVGEPIEVRFARRAADRTHRSWYTQDFLRGLRGYDSAEQWRAWGGSDELEPLSRLQRVDLLTTVPAFLMAGAERVERHSGLRWKHPLLARTIVDHVSRLPQRYRLDVDHDRVVLQRAARRLLTPQIIQRPDRPIAGAPAAWIRDGLRSPIEQSLFDEVSSGLFAPEALRTAWYGLTLGRGRSSVGLWRVAALEAWIRNVLNGGSQH